MVSIIESVLPVMMMPGYTALFRYTVDSLPGAVYLVGAAAFVIVTLILG